MRHSTLLVKYASDQAVSDASLMSDFLRTKSPAAFQELMHRHGPLVWSVGRRMNLTVADAEDMFQATFLVLFEQAARWQQSGTLACWLYGIAWRIGTKLKRNTVREQQRQQRVALAEGYESRDDGWQLHLDAALAQLPAHYREPLVLCYLEGQTHAKAAQTLGWPIGTVAGRLARARELLRRRLIQQGIAPAVLTTALVEPLRASLPEGLQVQTWQCLQQRVPPALQSLIQGVFPIMNKSALVMASCLLLLAVAGLCWAAYPVPEPQRSTVQPIGKAEEASAEDYQRLQGTWLRSINHEVTNWTVGGEGLVFRDKKYTVLFYPTETDGQVVRMADPKATKSRNFALSKVNGALRIELIDYGFDTQKLLWPSKDPQWPRNLVERYVGDVVVAGDKLTITFDQKIVYVRNADGTFAADREHPQPISSDKTGRMLVYHRSKEPSLDTLINSRLMSGEVAYGYRIPTSFSSRFKVGDRIKLEVVATDPAKPMRECIVKNAEILAIEQSKAQDLPCNLILRVTHAEALVLKFYESDVKFERVITKPAE